MTETNKTLEYYLSLPYTDMIDEAKMLWLETAIEEGIDIPEPEKA